MWEEFAGWCGSWAGSVQQRLSTEYLLGDQTRGQGLCTLWVHHPWKFKEGLGPDGRLAGEQWLAMSGNTLPHPHQGTGACYMDLCGCGCSQFLVKELSLSMKPAKAPGPLEGCSLVEPPRW